MWPKVTNVRNYNQNDFSFVSDSYSLFFIYAGNFQVPPESDQQHTECSNLAEATSTKQICYHENNVPSPLNRTSCGKVHECHKAIAMITGTVHYFHDNIYIYIYIYIYILYTWWPLNVIQKYTYTYATYIYIFTVEQLKKGIFSKETSFPD